MTAREASKRLQPAVIFLHIPKAGAGRSLSSVLDPRYRQKETYSIGIETKRSIQEFVDLPLQQRSQIKLLKGNMPFGLHNHIPRPCVYITLLRDPIDRVMSHYDDVKRTPEHYLHQRVIQSDMSLADYVMHSNCPELDNGQTRLLAGIDGEIPFGQLTDDVLERAQRNLREYFPVVGVAERFDESLLLLQRLLGWRLPPVYCRQHVTVSRPRREALPASLIESIRACTRYDQILYDTAMACFTQHAALTIAPRSLAQFRLLNRAYGTVCNTYHRCIKVR